MLSTPKNTPLSIPNETLKKHHRHLPIPPNNGSLIHSFIPPLLILKSSLCNKQINNFIFLIINPVVSAKWLSQAFLLTPTKKTQRRYPLNSIRTYYRWVLLLLTYTNSISGLFRFLLCKFHLLILALLPSL